MHAVVNAGGDSRWGHAHGRGATRGRAAVDSDGGGASA